VSKVFFPRHPGFSRPFTVRHVASNELLAYVVSPGGTAPKPVRQAAVHPSTVFFNKFFSRYCAMEGSPQSVSEESADRRLSTLSQKVPNSKELGNQAEPRTKLTKTGSNSARERRGSPVTGSFFFASCRKFCFVCCKHLPRKGCSRRPEGATETPQTTPS
jgi:hypothetical protein